jgi:hypothetical protein
VLLETKVTLGVSLVALALSGVATVHPLFKSRDEKRRRKATIKVAVRKPTSNEDGSEWLENGATPELLFPADRPVERSLLLVAYDIENVGRGPATYVEVFQEAWSGEIGVYRVSRFDSELIHPGERFTVTARLRHLDKPLTVRWFDDRNHQESVELQTDELTGWLKEQHDKEDARTAQRLDESTGGTS